MRAGRRVHRRTTSSRDSAVRLDETRCVPVIRARFDADATDVVPAPAPTPTHRVAPPAPPVASLLTPSVTPVLPGRRPKAPPPPPPRSLEEEPLPSSLLRSWVPSKASPANAADAARDFSQAKRPDWLQRGERVGPYEIQDRVGVGGFGALYRVTRGGKEYALKIPLGRMEELDPDEREAAEERLGREVGTLLMVRHPNVVRVREFFRWPNADDGVLCIAMDFVRGQPFCRWVRDARPTLRAVLTALARVGQALDGLHRHNIHHRDLKSGNVLVTADGNPVLVDFGIARPRSAFTLTQEATLLGTYTHWAPEYVAFVHSPAFATAERFAFTPATDLYAVGTMAYGALCGREPHWYAEGDGPRGPGLAIPGDFLDALKERDVDPPSRHNRALPGAVDALLLKLLARSPRARFQSGLALAAAVGAVLADRSLDATLDARLVVPAPPSAEERSALQQTRGRRRPPPPPPVSDVGPAALATDKELPAVAPRVPPAVMRPAPGAMRREVIRPAFVNAAVVKGEGEKPEVAEPTVVPPAAAKPEPAKPEAVRSEAEKPESAKPEALQPEAVKSEAVKPEAVKPEAVKSEPAMPESAKPEAVKPESAKPESAKPEPAKPEGAKSEPAKSEVPKLEVVNAEAGKRRVGKAEVVKFEAADPEAADAEASEPDAGARRAAARPVDPDLLPSIEQTVKFVSPVAGPVPGSPAAHPPVAPAAAETAPVATAAVETAAAAAPAPASPAAGLTPHMVALARRNAQQDRPRSRLVWLLPVLVGLAVFGLTAAFLGGAGAAPPPRSLLTEVERGEGPPQFHAPLPAYEPPAPQDLAPVLEQLEAPPPPKQGKRRSRGADAAQVDALLKESYRGKPLPSADAAPGWLRPSPDAVLDAGVGLRVPMGAELKVRLQKPLDSRTVAGGPVVARLSRPFTANGAVLLPAGTMLYGTASASGAGRFDVRFARLKLPDDSEVAFEGLAMDAGDQKPGLAPSRRIAAVNNEPGLFTRILKVTGVAALGKLSGNDGVDLARGAGETVLNHPEKQGAQQPQQQDALLLDAPVDFTVFVTAAF